MNRLACLCALALTITAATFALLAETSAQERKAAELALSAKRLEKAPELKAVLDDTWKSASMLEVSTKNSPDVKGPNVELRAVHDGEYIYLMARWADEDLSDVKQAWQFKDGKWQAAEGDEDRFAVAINGNVAAFAEKGCAGLCHYGAMTTNVEGQHADLWHWKAARGGQNGHADDQNFNSEVKGRVDDAGKGAYEGNANDKKDAPKWVWKEDADRKAAFTAETSRELPADFKAEQDYSVPSIRLRAPEGSRGDVQSAAEFKDGWWTVVLKRKLDTGNADDTALKAGETTAIAVAVFDDTGAKTGKEHAKSAVIKLTLEK